MDVGRLTMVHATIKQVAERCGVAVSTVSRAMNNRSNVSRETRERILAVAQEIGYVPNANARGLKISDLLTVAVIIQGHTSELLVEILGRLQNDLAERGIDVHLQHIPDNEASPQRLYQVVSEREPNGIVFLGSFGANSEGMDDEMNQAIEAIHVPIVFCTAMPLMGTASRHSSISVNDTEGAAQLTRLLIERGHTRIAFAAADRGPALEGRDAWASRYRGYRHALAEAGIDLDPDLTVPATDNVDIYSVATGYDSVKRWIAEKKPEFTAIVTSCDAVGVGTLRALHDSHIAVPQQVEVTAFDGLEISQYSWPSLTTIVQPLKQISDLSAEVIHDAVTNPGHQPQHILLEGTLRLGESTSRPL